VVRKNDRSARKRVIMSGCCGGGSVKKFVQSQLQPKAEDKILKTIPERCLTCGSLVYKYLTTSKKLEGRCSTCNKKYV
jgi:hypothetical protein